MGIVRGVHSSYHIALNQKQCAGAYLIDNTNKKNNSSNKSSISSTSFADKKIPGDPPVIQKVLKILHFWGKNQTKKNRFTLQSRTSGIMKLGHFLTHLHNVRGKDEIGTNKWQTSSISRQIYGKIVTSKTFRRNAPEILEIRNSCCDKCNTWNIFNPPKKDKHPTNTPQIPPWTDYGCPNNKRSPPSAVKAKKKGGGKGEISRNIAKSQKKMNQIGQKM